MTENQGRPLAARDSPFTTPPAPLADSALRATATSAICPNPTHP
jgi:hypothetical protein